MFHSISVKYRPVVAGWTFVTCLGSLMNGLQWEPSYPVDIADIIISPSLSQLWLVCTLPFYFHTAGELLFSTALLATAASALEVQWGSVKTLRFCASAQFIAWTVRLLLFQMFSGYGTVLPGPYFVIFAFAAVCLSQSPKALPLSVYDLILDHRSLVLLFAVQLASLHDFGLVMAISGAIAGIAANSQAYSLLPFPAVPTRIIAWFLPKRPARVRIVSSRHLQTMMRPSSESTSIYW